MCKIRGVFNSSPATRRSAGICRLGPSHTLPRRLHRPAKRTQAGQVCSRARRARLTLTGGRVRGGARKALLQRRVGGFGSLRARRDRLLEADALAVVMRGPGGVKAGTNANKTLAQWEGPPALRGTTSRKTPTYTILNAPRVRAMCGAMILKWFCYFDPGPG